MKFRSFITDWVSAFMGRTGYGPPVTDDIRGNIYSVVPLLTVANAAQGERQYAVEVLVSTALCVAAGRVHMGDSSAILEQSADARQFVAKLQGMCSATEATITSAGTLELVVGKIHENLAERILSSLTLEAKNPVSVDSTAFREGEAVGKELSARSEQSGLAALINSIPD